MLILKVFLLCLVLHFFADFTLQGCLANLKCREWWENNYPQKLYAKDYICALCVHSLYWTVITAAPIIWLWRAPVGILVLLLVVHVVIHACTDHEKANRRSINLTADQTIHLVQVALLVTVWAAQEMKWGDVCKLH